MMTLIPQIRKIWSTGRQQVLNTAQEIVAELQHSKISSPEDELDKSILEKAYAELGSRFDQRYGGFSNAPKFPSPHNLLFLLRYWHRTGEEHALEISALDFGFGLSFEVVIAGKSSSRDTEAMVDAVRRQFSPNKVLLFVPGETLSPDITKIAQFTKYQTSIDGKATAYVCRDYMCSAPTTDITRVPGLMQK